MLILDPDSNFRDYILNLDLHNFSLDYPWVMTPLSNTVMLMVSPYYISSSPYHSEDIHTKYTLTLLYHSKKS
jgi:hypothetical protein